MFGEITDNQDTGATPFALVAEGATAISGNMNEDVVNGTAQLKALVDIGPDQQSLIDNWEALNKEAADTIRIAGDQNVRLEAAYKQKVNEMNGLASVYANAAELDPTGELAQGAVLAARNSIAEQDQRRAAYALEQEAIKNIQVLAATDPTQAELLLHNIEHGGPLDVQREYLTKRLILQREVAKRSASVEDRNFLEMAGDFVLGALPFRSGAIREGNVDIDKGLKNWYDKVFSGQRQNREVDSLWSMPIGEFVDYVPQMLDNMRQNSTFFGFESKAAEFNLMAEYGEQTPAAWETNSFAGLDVVGIIPFGKAGSAASYLMRGGGRKQAIDVIASDIIKGSADAKVLDNALPQSMAQGSGISNVGVGITVGEKMLLTDEALALMPNVATQRFANEAEQIAAVKRAVDKLDEITGTYKLVATSKKEVLLPDGTSTWQVEGTIGKADGTGFARESTALTALRKMGIEGDVVSDGPPPVKDGFIRVYHGGRANAPGEWFSTSQTYAEGYAKRSDEPGVFYTDLAETDPRVSTDVPGNGPKNGFTFNGKLTDAEIQTLKPLSLDRNGSVVQDTAGQWFIKAARDVQEHGFYNTDVSQKGVTNILSRLTLGTKNMLDDFSYATANQAGGARQRTMKVYEEEVRATFGKLNGAELRDLDGVLQWGQENATWLDKDQFNKLYSRAYNRAPRAAEWDSYATYRNLNDVEYEVRNGVEYKKRVVAGFENVTIDGPGFKVADENAKVKRTWDLHEGARVYDASTGVLYNNTNRITADVIKRLKDEGYILVETERALNTAKGSPVRQILTKQGNLTTGPLRRKQLGYSEGGHRFYRDRNFAKQAMVTRLEDGSEFLNASRTYVAGSKAEMQEWTKLANELLDYIKTSPAANVEDMWGIIGRSKAVIDPQTFLDDVNAGRINRDMPFEALDDRQLPSIYTGRNSEYAFDEDLALSQGSGQMYYSGKGEQLKNYKDQLARTFDPYRAINRSLQNIAQLSSFTDFKLSSMSRWVETFRRLEVLDIGNFREGMTDEFIFANSKIVTSANDKIRQIAEGQRDAIKRILNWKTEGDMATQAMSQRIAEFVAGDTPGLRDKMVTNARDWLQDNNPLNFIRGWAFDTTLGMFNISQLYVQSSTFLAISAMNLKGGVHGFMSLMPTSAYMLSKGSDRMLDHLISKGTHKLVGFADPEEFKLYMRSIRGSGILDIGGSHSLIGDYGASVSTGAFSGVEKVREAGRFFFKTAEQSNLTAAYRAAWYDVADQFPKMDKKGRDFQRAVYSRAMDYSFGMQRESQAWWQRGLMSVPTQFFSYNARMLEALFSGTFTREQRARLAASQLFLYGTAGVPLASMITDWKKNKEGEAPEAGSLDALFDRGFIDQAYYMATGYDVQLGNRLSSGEFLQNTVRDIFGVGEYGQVSVADMFGGASFQIWGGAIGDMGDWAKYAIAESGTPGAEALSRDAVIKLARNISTVDRGIKAWTLMNYGTYTTRNGVTLVDDLPTDAGYALAIGMGGSPGELEDMAAGMAYKKNFDKQVDDAAKIMRNYRTQYLNEPDNRAEIRQQINLFTNLLPDNVARAAIRKSNRQSESLYKAISERAEKIRQSSEAEQSQQDGQP